MKWFFTLLDIFGVSTPPPKLGSLQDDLRKLAGDVERVLRTQERER